MNWSTACRVVCAACFLLLASPRAHAQTFADVPTDHWAYSFIEALASYGITSGCGGGNYCPDANVTRAQMAVFLERAMRSGDYSPPAATGSVFDDVGAADFAAAFIEQLYADGITAGCGGGNYCPRENVTRAQMAVFLLRARYGPGYQPPAVTATVFDDVGVDDFAAAWIHQLAADGITSGCGNNRFCPRDAVNREQMAVFLARAFDLVWPRVFTLSSVTGTGGSVYPAAHEVEQGSSVFFTLVSDPGYELGQVSGCGGELRGNIFEIANVGADCVLNASFDVETPGGLPDSLGAQRTLVALINFPDNNDTSFMSVERATELVRDDDSSLNRFIIENSDGKAWVEPHFLDWITLNQDSSYYFSETSYRQGEFTNDAVSAIVDAVPSASQFDRLIIMGKDGYLGFPGCYAFLGRSNFGSTSTFNGYVAVLGGYDMGCNRPGRIEHEYGHTFGFKHTRSHSCNDVPSRSLVDIEYANVCASTNVVSRAHDTLGGDTFQPMYSPAWRELAGWLEPDEVVEAYQPGLYTLVQSSAPTPGVKLIKIPFGAYVDSTRLYHYVELRAAAGQFDPASFAGDLDGYEIFVRTPNVLEPGPYSLTDPELRSFDLMDYYEGAYSGQSILDIGTDFVDPYRDVSISVVAVRGTGASLEVDLSIQPPRSAVLPTSLLRFREADTAELQFSLQNTSSTALSVSSVSIGGRDASGFAVGTNACDAMTLQPLEQCAVTVVRVSELSGLATVDREMNGGAARQLVEIVADSILEVPPYDPNAPLQWQDPANQAVDVDWRAAVQFCELLDEDGVDDWRLPLIDELRAAFQFTDPPLYELDSSEAVWSITEVDPTRAFYV